MEGQDLESVRNKQAREANVVEDTKEPDEYKLGVSGGLIGKLSAATGITRGWWRRDRRVFVHSADNGPAHKGHYHARNCRQEQRAASDLVDGQ